MTQEEKAKRYDEATKVIKNNLDALNEITETGAEVVNIQSIKNCFYRAFPELKESEDERIRKALIKLFKTENFNGYVTLDGIDIEDVLAWLEKRDEQPKKVSIWKHWKNGIAGNGEGKPIYLIKDGYTYSLGSCLCFECDYIELSELDKLLSEKQGEQKSVNKVEPKFKVEKDKWYVCISQYCNCIEGRNYKATSDGRIIDDYGTEYDMHSDAYKWFRPWTIQDAKDGDVLACENGWTCIFKCLNDNLFSSHCFMDNEGWFCEDGGQAHTLDERICGEIYPATKEQRDTLMKTMADAGYTFDFVKKELKKIEHNPTWSEKDAGYIKDLISYFSQNEKLENTKEDVIVWLKSLKERALPQPVQKWSEKDEKMCNDTIQFIEKGWTDNGKSHLIPWLKSLKLQNTWKPSDEQVTWLYRAADDASKDSRMKQILNELLSDLKKLKEK